MSISFGTKILTFLNISELLKVVGISVIFLVLIFQSKHVPKTEKRCCVFKDTGKT